VSDLDFLTAEDLLLLARRLGVGPVRDLGLLDSSAARARSSVFGEDAYLTIELKAAALLHSVAANHCLVDGNERLAFLAATVFLDLNGHDVDLTDDEAFQVTMDVASGAVRDVPEIARRLKVRERR
jgi:death-on-curing protein